MTYQALARTWRPKNFHELTGQNHVVRSLTYALNQQKIHPAYLFTGTRGVGKTTLARILAKCLNCERGITADPCEQCEHCVAINQGHFPDLIEIDAASRTKVEDTREILNQIVYAPQLGRYKVYLIDEVHMLSQHSFNALLKTLEEPPEHIQFIFATTDLEKLPTTILSRCVQFHLKHLSAEQITERIQLILEKEQISFDLKGLNLIADAANGSMRDALTLLDQAIAFCGGQLTEKMIAELLGHMPSEYVIELLHLIAAAETETLLKRTSELAAQNCHFEQALKQFQIMLHQMSCIQLTGNITIDPNLAELSQMLSKETVQLFYEIATRGIRDLAYAPNEKIAFEMTLLRMIAFEMAAPKKIESISVVEKKIEIKPEIKPEIKSALSITSASSWPEVMQALNLSGPLKALASHCSLKEQNDHKMILQLDPNLQAILNEQQRSALQKAISDYLKKPMEVHIIIEKNQQDTPVQIQEKQTQAEKKALENKLKANKNVQMLESLFAAKLESDTIIGPESNQ